MLLNDMVFILHDIRMASNSLAIRQNPDIWLRDDVSGIDVGVGSARMGPESLQRDPLMRETRSPRALESLTWQTPWPESRLSS